ncbi:MAG TPA: methyl-accepting chemotaxis protein [Bryobacteraceae bacterium]|nr:methyl-accepting chemotaxis protein [Bryobacteraceae bacterium]
MRLLRTPFAMVRSLFQRLRIRECLDVLAVVRRQLLETSRQVEESVVGVCGNFSAIAARARETVAESAIVLDGRQSEGSASVESAIESSRRTIGSLLERMERAGKLSAMAVSSMEEVSRTVTGIEDLLGQVARIAFTNKLVALNAKIEAVHVGELGAGFEVVADEISRQADRSAELAEVISSRIEEMRSHVNSTAGDLREFLAEGRQKLDESRGEAEKALTMLLAVHQRTRDLLERNRQENARLAGDIASTVVGLQFQDRVKQRVEHVVEALQRLEGVLGGEHQATEPDAASSLMAGVHASYTMQSEREAHSEAANQSASSAAEPAEMEVELF